MTDQPDAATLKQWEKRWRQLSSEMWSELVASFTPEQRALYERRNVAITQAKLCSDRIRQREPIAAKRTLAWPKKPPE